MRMGQIKKRRGSRSGGGNKKTRGRNGGNDNNENDNKASSSSSSAQPGDSICPNVLSSAIGPALTNLATRSLEEYADAALAHRDWGVPKRRAADAAVGGDDTATDADADADDGAAPSEDGESSSAVPPPLPNPYRLFLTQSNVDEFREMIDESSSHFVSPPATRKGNKVALGEPGAWKIHLNAAKFERRLDERYGRLRPFITSHPEVEAFVKTFQRRLAAGKFSPLRSGEPPLGITSSVILLFMMHRRGVRFDAVILAATFLLVGLQPWALVTIVSMIRGLAVRRKGKRIQGMPAKFKVAEPYYARTAEGTEPTEDGAGLSEEEETKCKYALLDKAVGAEYNPADLTLGDEPKPDVLVLGGGMSALYTAALLARAGRRVLVLSPDRDASLCCELNDDDKHRPFDITDCGDVPHLSKVQSLLAPALCTTTDTMGGIRFARIGSESDGFAHSILSVPGLGGTGGGGECNNNGAGGCDVPVVLTAGGPAALANHAADSLGDGYPGTATEDGAVDGDGIGDSASLGYLTACRQVAEGAGGFHLSKLLPNDKKPTNPGVESFESGGLASSSPGSAEAYRQASIRPASSLLDKCLPLHARVRSLMAAVGMPNENLRPDQASMAAHAYGAHARTSREGMAYPVGGPRALCAALASVVEQCGGRVVGGVGLQELLFEDLPPEEEKKLEAGKDENNMGKEKKAKAKKGGEKKDGKELVPASGQNVGPKPRCRGVRLENGQEVTVTSSSPHGHGAVVSTVGFIPTFLHLLPTDVRTAHGVPQGLPALSERRPLFKLMVSLRGSAADLSLTGADWYRLPNAAPPLDEMDSATGQVKFGTIGVDADGIGRDDPKGDAGGEGSSPLAINGAETSTTTGGGDNGGGGNKKQPRRTKFVSGASWMKVSFPSAKDPSWVDRYGDVSTCVVTVEADDDFVREFDSKPKLFSIIRGAVGTMGSSSGDAQRLTQRVMKDLVEVFPQLEGRVERASLSGPFRAGLSHNGPRFAIKGNRPDTPYPGLYVGGADLTVGDSFSGSLVGGWMAANAVAGYSLVDYLYLGKNITSDLAQFVDEPCMINERNGVAVEDLAVPFKQATAKTKDNDDDDERSAEEEDGGADSTAESSKEK